MLEHFKKCDGRKSSEKWIKVEEWGDYNQIWIENKSEKTINKLTKIIEKITWISFIRAILKDKIIQ